MLPSRINPIFVYLAFVYAVSTVRIRFEILNAARIGFSGGIRYNRT